MLTHKEVEIITFDWAKSLPKKVTEKEYKDLLNEINIDVVK